MGTSRGGTMGVPPPTAITGGEGSSGPRSATAAAAAAVVVAGVVRAAVRAGLGSTLTSGTGRGWRPRLLQRWKKDGRRLGPACAGNVMQTQDFQGSSTAT